MAFINNLEDWILEDIFKMLIRHDRLICKEVCKRWYCILMERKVFGADRHIFLNTINSIDTYAAMNVLIQAKLPYEKYTIFDHTTVPQVGFQQFLELVGPLIKEFVYQGYAKNCDFFSVMPLLENLTLKTSLKITGKIFSTIKRNNSNFVYRYLKCLQLKGISQMDFEYALTFVKYIKQFIPQECYIVMSGVSVHTNNQFKHLCKILEEVQKFNEIEIRANQILQTEIEKLLEVNNDFYCDKLTMHCTTEHHPYRFLGSLQNNIKDIELHCYSLPPYGIELPKITLLEVTFSGIVSSLKSLDQLTNLKNLILEIHQNECGFGHESLLMTNVQNVDMDMKLLCNECLQAISNSFENMDYCSLITTSTISWYQIKMLICNWKKLQNFHLNPNEVINQEEDFTFDSKEYLHWICIKNISNLRIETIRKMSESFHILESLNLHTYNSLHVTPLLNIVQAIVSAFAKIESFTFSFYMPGESEEYVTNEFNIFCDYMASIGFPIINSELEKEKVIKNNCLELHLDREEMTSELN